ncbi:MAG: hypothetical protein PHH26_00530 [Candidatus Thermoplasmatota archaeon]|nr:hypothetical protein [Candidatus Thermoplasmatota archaeon]
MITAQLLERDLRQSSGILQVSHEAVAEAEKRVSDFLKGASSRLSEIVAEENRMREIQHLPPIKRLPAHIVEKAFITHSNNTPGGESAGSSPGKQHGKTPKGDGRYTAPNAREVY